MNNETPKIKLTGVFPKTFRVYKRTQSNLGSRKQFVGISAGIFDLPTNDSGLCCFEYTDDKKEVMFQVSLHGAVELREHFLKLGYTELAPKMRSWQ